MIYFFDTSALQYRYIDGARARGIRRIISSKETAAILPTYQFLNSRAQPQIIVARTSGPFRNIGV